MAYIPGSIGRNLQGELFVVDGDGNPHIKGSDRFVMLWIEFLAPKRKLIDAIYEKHYSNHWFLIFGNLPTKPLLNCRQFWVHIFDQFLGKQFVARCEADKIKLAIDHVSFWLDQLIEYYPLNFNYLTLQEYINKTKEEK